MKRVLQDDAEPSNTNGQDGAVSNESILLVQCSRVIRRFKAQDLNQRVSAAVFIVQNLLQISLPRRHVLQLKKQLKMLSIAASGYHAQNHDGNSFEVSKLV